ncbi:hypothetical protein M3O96_11175 [Aquiflexum sp. TKW24L]|uniref:hypothetical protein n=1 Tax=Aquiflexum sp. TKW24L TaxID=2942212 RepID=UPI0020C04FDC|nr:hypothetical protein [Aquiflexum sp. TKW24L]MCL6259656.1 hypothetical protein [Aquiflexum sp. TKW24L]
MKKILTILIVSLSLSISERSFGQEEKEGSNHGVFFEFLGNGIFNSLNYDTRFTKKVDGFGGKVGFGYAPVDGGQYFSFPFMVNYLLGKNGHYFEVGAGANYMVADYRNGGGNIGSLEIAQWEGWSGNMSLGYRYQPVDGGFLFRAGITPMFIKDEFIPFWPQISIGYAF